MNTQTESNSDWNETKSKIKARFGKLTDGSIESVKGNLDLLSGKLQHAYGYAKDQAEREFMTFKASLNLTESKDAQAEIKPAKPANQKVA